MSAKNSESMTDPVLMAPTAAMFSGAVTNLDLSGRGITELPPKLPASLARSRINVLSLAGNTLTELPAWFSTHFPHVRQMDLSHNPLGDGAFSQLGRKFGRTCRLLRHLNLANCCLKSIPDPVFGLLDLTVLVLGEDDKGAFTGAEKCDDNTIYKLPERLTELKWLTKLDAANVMLLELPSSIGRCHGLTHLDVHSNSIYWFPDSICDLKNLAYLNASSNAIEMLPQGFHTLSSLHELRLAHNSITWLSEDIGELNASLRFLDMYENALDPEGAAPVAGLSSLTGVDLSNNDVSAEDVMKFVDSYALLEDNLRKRVCREGEERRPMPLTIDRSARDDEVDEKRAGRWHDDDDGEEADDDFGMVIGGDDDDDEFEGKNSSAEMECGRSDEECWDAGPEKMSDEDPFMTAIDASWEPPPRSSPSAAKEKLPKNVGVFPARAPSNRFTFCPADLHAIPLRTRPDPLRRLLIQRKLIRPGGFYVQVQKMRTAPRLGKRTFCAAPNNDPPVRGQFDDAD